MALVNFLKVKYPRKFLFLENKLKLICMLIVIFICDSIVNIPNMFQFITYKNNTDLSCASSNTMSIVSNFTTSILRSVIHHS